MNLNRIFILFILGFYSIFSMGHVPHGHQEYVDQEKKEQKNSTLVKEYLAYNKTCDKSQLDHIKQEYEKSKGNQLVQAINKLRSPKEGLLGTTVVKTDNGYRKISELQAGDTICCYDFTNQKETLSKVTYADKVHLKKHVQIVVNDQIVRVSPSHKFYIHSLNMWVTATDIKNNENLRELVDPNIKDVKEVKEALDVVRITVDDKRNYFITDHNILVHNFVIEGSIWWGAGEGAIIAWSILKPTLIGLGIIGTSYVGHKVVSQNKATSFNQPHRMIFDWDAFQRDLPPEQRYTNWIAKNSDQNKTPQAPKLNDNGSGAPQDPNKNDKEKEKNSTIIKLVEESKPGQKTRGGKATQFEKTGTYEDALKDFDKLKPTNVKDIPNGKAGTLPDGRPVNVRHASRDSRPTLEIQNDKYDYLKFRYGFK